MARDLKQEDHEFIIKTIIDNDGVIVGGYVRAWVVNGGLKNDGWSDIDCQFKSLDGAKNTKLKLFETLGDLTPPIDVRRRVNHMDNFWCNCWKFDGEIKMMEPALSSMKFEDLEQETKNKIARCILPLRWAMRFPHKIKTMILHGWDIVHSDGTPISKQTKDYILGIH